MVESLLKKAMLFQAEVASILSERVQEVATSYVEKGTLHDADAKKFVSEVREKLNSTEKEIEEKFGKVSKMFQDMTSGLKQGAVPSDDLESEIDKLEKRLEELKIKKEMAARNADK